MPTKPTISVRPPPPADPEKIQAFIEQGEPAQPTAVKTAKRQHVETSKRKNAKTPTAALPKTVVARKDGLLMKRLTIWIPNELAVRFSVQCASEQRDVSSALAEAAEAWLKTR